MEKGDRIKLYCKECQKQTNADILCVHNHNWFDSDSNIGSDDYYCIVKCCGCDFISFLKKSYFSEDIEFYDNPNTGETEQIIQANLTHWPPKSARKRPEWVSELHINNRTLYRLFNELYKCLDNDVHILSCIGTRTLFDSISLQLGIDPTLTFKDKLDSLVKNGQISGNERQSLNILVEAGSAAAHRGWKPKVSELNTVVDILEHFAQRVLAIEKSAQELHSKIPPKPVRKTSPKT